jgi:hypothetical protein
MPITMVEFFSAAGRCLVEARSDLATRLRRSQGFVVETATGRFGTVEDFRVGAPGFLVVRAGWLGRRRVMISIEDVSAVLPRQKVVRLRSTWMSIKT